MTNGATDRLDRIEAILAQVAQSQAETAVAQQRTQQLIDSNARAIEANSNEIAQLRESQRAASEQFREELRQADEQFRAELRQADEQSRQRLDETIADVVDMMGDLGRQQSETDQRFNNLLTEARADRQTNSRERREFRSFMRQMAEEIRRIWQRLAS